MNYTSIAIAAVAVVAVIVICLGIRRLVAKRHSGDNMVKSIEEIDKEIMETSGTLIKDLPPVNGPEPENLDYDNLYTNTNSEPLVVAEKDELTDLQEKITPCDQNGRALGVSKREHAVRRRATRIDVKPFSEYVAKTDTHVKPGRKNTKKETVKPAASAGKKTTKTKSSVVKNKKDVKVKRKYTRHIIKES